MSTSIGDLFVNVSANIASLTTGLNQAASSIDKFSRDVTSRFAELGSRVDAIGESFKALAGLAATTFAGNAILDWSKQVIESAASLTTLRSETGSTVEELSRLQNIATYTGLGFDQMRTFLERLSAGMAGTDDQSNKVAKALQFLGVTARDPAQALQDIATKLNQYADGAGKAAIARDLFGKGGVQFLETLKEMADAQGLVSTRSTEEAEAADALLKQIRLLTIESNTFKDALLQNVVPALLETVRQFNIAKEAGVGTLGALAFAGVDPSAAVAAIAKIGTAIDDLKGKIAGESAELAKYGNSPYFNGALLKQALAQDQAALDDAQRKLRIWIQIRDASILQNVQRLGYTGDARDELLNRKPPLPYGGGGDASQVSEFTRLMAQLQQEVQHAQQALDEFGLTEELKTSPAMQKLIDLMGSSTWAKFTAAQQQQARDALLDADALQHSLTGLKASQEQAAAYAKVLDDLAKHEQDHVDAVRKFVDGLVDSNDELKAQIGAIGLTGEALDLYNNEVDRGRALKLADNDVERGRINALYDARAALLTTRDANQAAGDAAKKAAEDTQRAWDEAAKSIQDAFLNMFEDAFKGGKSLFDDLKNYAIKIFESLVLRPIVAPLSAGLASLAIPGGANATGLSALAGGIPGIGISGLDVGSIFGGANPLSTLLGTGSGLLGLPSLSAAAANLGIAASAGTVAIGGVSTVLASLASVALPVVGIFAALAAAGGLFGNKTPSEVQGQFGVRAGTGGFEDNASTSSPFGNLGFIDAGTRYFSGQAAQAFSTAVSQLLDQFASRESQTQIGQTATALQNTAFPQLSGTFTTEDFLNKYGDQILKQVAVTAFQVLDPALASVAQGFQGTGQDLAKFIDGLLSFHDLAQKLPHDVAASLESAIGETQAGLDKVAAFANAFLGVQAVLNADPLNDALAVIRAQSQSAADAFADQGTALQKLIDSFDGSSSAATQLASATQSYYAAEVQLLAQIEQVKTSIGGLFTDTIRSITLQTLDNAGKGNFLNQEIASLQTQLFSSSDPAQIQALASRINQDINQLFGLLSPQEQQQQLGTFTANIGRLNDEVTARLNEVEQSTQSAASALEDVVRGALTDAITQFGDAATTTAGAAATMNDAANTDLVASQNNLAASQQPIIVAVPQGLTNG